jgi:hypothetical protein
MGFNTVFIKTHMYVFLDTREIETSNLNQTFRMANSDTINVVTAINMFITFKGGNENDLAPFKNKCEFVIDNVSGSVKPNIAIISNLKGEAFKTLCYRKI